MNSTEVQIHDRGYLPHWEAPEATYSITLRLRDSLPASVIRTLVEEKQALETAITSGARRLTAIEEMRVRGDIERRFDAALDRHSGVAFMNDPRVAELMAATLTYFEGARYELDAWSVMPNHLHVIVRPLGEWRLRPIIHSWKTWSAKRANELIGRHGPFWQREYYDRIIRDEEDLHNAVSYVLANPAKAGLRNWVWTSDTWTPMHARA